MRRNIHDNNDGEAWGSVPLGFVAMAACVGANHPLPSKNVIKTSQLEVLAALQPEDEVMTQYGQDNSDDEGLFGVSWAGKLILWVLDAAKQIQVRLMVCAHMGARCHCGHAFPPQAPKPYCVRSSREKGVADFIQQRLHYIQSTARVLKPRPLREVVHVTGAGGVVYLGFLCVRTAGPLGLCQAGVATPTPKYRPVIVEEIGGHV